MAGGHIPDPGRASLTLRDVSLAARDILQSVGDTSLINLCMNPVFRAPWDIKVPWGIKKDPGG